MADWMVQQVQGKGDGPRVAVKDIIDIAGMVTAAGSKVLATSRQVAEEDAPVVAQTRAQGGVIVAKSVLVELAYGAQGINPWFGTPSNPISQELIPGGSSSGSAVGVARGEVDLSFGTDTGGSVRIPATCCGILGLKTTHGRVSNAGVYPLSSSLDTVGPFGRTIGALRQGMEYLCTDFDSSQRNPFDKVLRVRTSNSAVIEGSIDAALDAASIAIGSASVDLSVEEAWTQGSKRMGYEAWRQNASLYRQRHRMDPKVAERLAGASQVTEEEYRAAWDYKAALRTRLQAIFDQGYILALATVPYAIPTLAGAYDRWLNINTLPFNLAGFPAISLPIPAAFSADSGFIAGTEDVGQGIGANGVIVPVSIQLVGGDGSEERLIATAESILSVTT